MNERKIIIVGPAYPYRGGQALVEAYLYKTLTELGYQCHTVSFTLLYPSMFFPGTTQFEESGFIAFPHTQKITRIINSINPITWIKAARYILRLKPHAVVFIWWMPFFGPAYYIISKILKWFGNTRIVFLMENFVSHEKRFFDRISAKITLKNAQYFICQSNFVKKQLTEVYNHKPVFETTLSIYDCYDLNKYNTHTAREHLGIRTKYVVLFFGLIRAYKGLDKLLEAFPQIENKLQDVTLLVAGENYESFDKYNELIEKSGVKERIQLHIKYIPNENIEPYFKAADVVCLPYYSATQSGIVMMAYGFRKPVVVTNTGGLKELVDEDRTGIVIENNNANLIANAVTKIIENRQGINFSKNIDDKVSSLGYKNLERIFEAIMK